MFLCTNFVLMHIYIEDMRTKKALCMNEAFLVKIANIIVISCPRCVDSVGICILYLRSS